ncbi:hypothetical protein FOL47_008722, partial [Perkinsus chesapeaki]
ALPRRKRVLMAHFMRIKLRKRPQSDELDLSKVDSHPGDIMVITRIDGDSAGLMFGAGTLASHTVIFLRDPDTEELPNHDGVLETPAEEFLKNYSGFIEAVSGWVERNKPETAKYLFLEGLNHRMDTSGLGLNDFSKLDDSKLVGGAAKLPFVPEKDEWTYHTHRSGTPAVGPSRFCSALVCEMLRAGGVLGDHKVSCTEFTPWDI